MYFSAFPIISYSNTQVIDITRRVAVVERRRGEPRTMQPLELHEGLRADGVADAYYNDPDFTWLVYLSGNIIDPTFEWYLPLAAFDSFVAKKYGSVEESQRLVHHYQLEWASRSQEELTVSFYNNNLEDSFKKYYEPVFGTNGRVLSYRRARLDWTVTTNMVLGIAVSNTSGNLVNGERAQFKDGSNNLLGNCEVAWSNSSYVVVQHVAGNTSTVGSTLWGANSNASAVLVTSTLLTQNIPEVELDFWRPLSCYDFERDINERRKFVRLVDSRFALDAKNELNQKLSE